MAKIDVPWIIGKPAKFISPYVRGRARGFEGVVAGAFVGPFRDRPAAPERQSTTDELWLVIEGGPNRERHYGMLHELAFAPYPVNSASVARSGRESRPAGGYSHLRVTP
jgi:hypothetical protein